ncbi:MAG: bifunctional phosphopantothenoylcysteine decarboxylase/phosphopantothenate--cysteine ligase CoaBC [Candidatus Delongbacteria bacterium]|nr:bifunctional phosphopantothenoylcysteine decarboxylase/phosphopantothenate--cysteine ligase CoaBC [Candidatus Delongbacteria bacterium]
MKNKKIILGITGGIAAYKSCYLIRYLVKAGAEVKVVATESGLKFVGEVTLRTLSNNNVYFDMFSEWNEKAHEHISITDWGDIFIVAPATANIIGKLANGIADDVLSTSLLAFDKQMLIAPAMNTKMYNNPAVQRNMEFLASTGVEFINPDTGDLACGYEGKGRMAEPEHIFRESKYYLNRTNELSGKKIVVTASRTEESLDPVRYLTNRSSGITGFKIAEQAAMMGAETILITGPTDQEIFSKVKRINVISAEDMFKAVDKEFDSCDCLIMSAAVADYTFEVSPTKIKKTDDKLEFSAKRTKDILYEMGQKKNSQVIVGFAMETNDAVENAKKKLSKKNADFIVLNSISEENPAFGSNENKISIVTQGNVEEFPAMDKEEIANIILDKAFRKP